MPGYRPASAHGWLEAAFKGLPAADPTVQLSTAVASVRATLFDLRNSTDTKFKLGASEVEVQEAMAARHRPTLLQADFEAAITHLESTREVNAVEGSRGICYALTPKGYAQEEEARLQWWRRQTRGELLEAAAKGLGLFALLLPVSGVLLRWFAFAFGAHLNVEAFRLAWSASPSELTATGFGGFLWPALFYAVIGLLMSWDLSRGPDECGARGRFMPLIWRIPAPIMLLLALVTLVFIVASPPTTLLSIAAGFTTGWVGVRIARQVAPLRLSHFWPIVVVGVLSSGIASGLNGNLAGVQPGDYVFASRTVADGRYIEVGNFEGVVYLMACHQRGAVVAVPQSGIVAFRLDRRHRRGPPHFVQFRRLWKSQPVERRLSSHAFRQWRGIAPFRSEGPVR